MYVRTLHSCLFLSIIIYFTTYIFYRAIGLKISTGCILRVDLWYYCFSGGVIFHAPCSWQQVTPIINSIVVVLKQQWSRTAAGSSFFFFCLFATSIRLGATIDHNRSDRYRMNFTGLSGHANSSYVAIASYTIPHHGSTWYRTLSPILLQEKDGNI